MPALPAKYEQLTREARSGAVLGAAQRVLSWDQETMMPTNGAGIRAEQLEMLAGMVHERLTSAKVGDLIAACESDKQVMSDPLAAAGVREFRREYDKKTKLPKSLVEEITKCSSQGLHAWRDARAKSDFSRFLPHLEKTIELARKKAECFGKPVGGELYDALMDEYEPGMTSARTAEVFKPLRAFTVELLDKVRSAPNKPSRAAAIAEFPIDKQKDFVAFVVKAIGFDFDSGRIDDSTHPFCEDVGPGDVRLTNRYRANGWADSISSGMHEAGHGMYEQGLNHDYFGTPLGQYISLGVHESQSRMWENLVGRSLPFWEWATPHAHKMLGGGISKYSASDVYKACNLVEPSFIRVESDEVTYNLHIMLRFDFERAMIRGDLKPKDLPGEWNKRIKADLGLTVPDDKTGCLQDIHWSMGAVGYFATYTFGNIYASQFWEAMAKDIPGRDDLMRKGDFAPILKWLREKIHIHGRRYGAEELCKMITGSTLDSAALMRHLSAKVRGVYGV
ncbi:MAG: carboxypeptidase M32 [Phycisphaerales bacterium]|nr:carboxypeptidase M32 [Phycisphaerales bacterium]